MKRKIIFIIIFMLICMATRGCGKASIESKIITKNALSYFVQKYNVKRKDIEIKYNNLYGKEAFCFNSCGSNDITIIYNNKEYKIQYNLENDSFGDNYQYEEIYNDFYQYLVNKIPFATSIKIKMLEPDVLATTTKYTGDIENYIKNTMLKTAPGNDSYTSVKIWIETKDEIQAKELHEKNSKTIITALQRLQVTYNVGFSMKEEHTDHNYAFYYYKVRLGTSPSFVFTDKVNNNRKTCNHSSVEFDGNTLICY